MSFRTTRRRFALGAAAMFGAGALARAETQSAPVELNWEDLIPGGDDVMTQALLSMTLVQHGELDGEYDTEAGRLVVEDYNGASVRLPGYVVPLEFSGVGVTSFLLVPYVGACIHVPPPPPNQLVFVTTETPLEIQGYFDAVFVTGEMETLSQTTELAEVGYKITAEKITPYE